MPTKPILFLALFLTCLPVQTIKARPLLPLYDRISFSLTNANFIAELAGFDNISVKRGQPYDETKDPALRKSVDRAEALPWGALIMPAIVFSVFVFVFLRKNDFD